jgi:hypothetical protein
MRQFNSQTRLRAVTAFVAQDSHGWNGALGLPKQRMTDPTSLPPLAAPPSANSALAPRGEFYKRVHVYNNTAKLVLVANANDVPTNLT